MRVKNVRRYSCGTLIDDRYARTITLSFRAAYNLYSDDAFALPKLWFLSFTFALEDRSILIVIDIP